MVLLPYILFYPLTLLPLLDPTLIGPLAARAALLVDAAVALPVPDLPVKVAELNRVSVHKADATHAWKGGRLLMNDK